MQRALKKLPNQSVALESLRKSLFIHSGPLTGHIAPKALQTLRSGVAQSLLAQGQPLRDLFPLLTELNLTLSDLFLLLPQTDVALD